MPPVGFFSSLGLLGVHRFLDPAVCADIRTEMSSADALAATVRAKDRVYAVDEQSRKTSLAQVSEAKSYLVRERLQSLRQPVEETFGIEVRGIKPPQFLRYREGDFFALHQDRSSDS